MNGHLIASADLRHFNAVQEGRVLSKVSGRHLAYECSAVTLTIGIGHTSNHTVLIDGWLNGKRYSDWQVVEGLEIDDNEAHRLHMIDIESHADYVRQAVQVELTQNQFDVLVDMVYQYGPKVVRQGSDILAALNGGIDDNKRQIGPRDYKEAQRQILRWHNKNEGIYRRCLARACYWDGKPWQWLKRQSVKDPKASFETTLEEALKIAETQIDEPPLEIPTFYRDPPKPAIKPVDVFDELGRDLERGVDLKAPPPARPTTETVIVTKPAPPLPKKPIDPDSRRPEDLGIDPNAPLKPARKSKRIKGIIKQEKAREEKGIALGGVSFSGALGIALGYAEKHDLITIAMVSFGVFAVLFFIAKIREADGALEEEEGRAEASQGLH